MSINLRRVDALLRVYVLSAVPERETFVRYLTTLAQTQAALAALVHDQETASWTPAQRDGLLRHLVGALGCVLMLVQVLGWSTDMAVLALVDQLDPNIRWEDLMML